MEYEWDNAKARSNLMKHGVSFEEARTVFDDPLYIDFFDPDHSDDEERYIVVGKSRQDRLIVVSYTERKSGIRVISAREATQREKDAYEEG